MSGIEVVGIVLAVLPLLISATEHYRDGHNFVARAIKKEFLTAQYRDELIQQRVLLRLYMKGVVGKTNLPHDVQHQVAESPTSEIWKDPKVVKAIVEELGEAHEPFTSVIARISRVLVKFVKLEGKFDISAVNNTITDIVQRRSSMLNEGHGHDSIWDRLKFSWKSSEWKSIIEELQSCNSMLERLSLAAERAKPFVKKQKSRNVHTAFQRRANAGKLFEILQKVCNCEPAGLQEVGIRLQASLKAGNDIKAQESMFRILIVDSSDATYEVSAGVEMVPEYSSPPAVRFTDNSPLERQDTSDMKLLEDICSETRAAHAGRAYLHLFADQTEQIYCSCVKSANHASTQPTKKSFTSLSEVLKLCKVYNAKRWLYKEKSILAINLAYSLLQLYDGPWYRQWSANNITFISEKSRVMTESGFAQISLRQPYTCLSISASLQLPAPAVPIKPSKRRVRRNAHLHALGIVLMELYLSYSIEDLAKEEETDDLRGLAQELLEEHADDLSMSREYMEAVRFCLSPRPNPHNGSFDFNDEGFREVYYSEVLAMLEENLTQNFDATENTWLFGSE